MYLPTNQNPNSSYHANISNFYRLTRIDLKKSANRLSWTLLISALLMAILLRILRLGILAFHNPIFSGSFGGLSAEIYYFHFCISYIFGLLGPFLVFMLLSDMPYTQAVPFQKVRPLRFICCLFIGFSVSMLANFPAKYVEVFLDNLGLQGTIPTLPLPTSLFANLLYLVGTVIIPGLTEEFVFRGIILSRLQKYGNGFAIFASSFLFGLYHGNFTQFVFAFIVGLILSSFVVRTKCLWISILIHIVNNGTAVLFQMLDEIFHVQNYEFIVNMIFYGLIFLGILFLIILMIADKSFFKIQKTYALEVPLGMRLSALFLNPGTLILVGYCLVTSILFVIPGWLL